MLKRLLIAVLVLWSAPLLADKPTILVLGDSLSAGYGLSAEAGWVALLEQRLTDQGLDYTVANASISGDTTRGGLSRLPQALTRHRPAVVIVALGGNDGLRGLPLQEMRDSLAAIIETAQGQGARVVLAGVRLPPNYGPAYTEAFHGVYRELTARYRVALVPYLLAGVDERAELMQSDGIHPTAEAQARMLENVWAVLAPLLQDAASAMRRAAAWAASAAA